MQISRLILINIQYTPRMTDMTAQETLTVLCKQLYIGLALFGAGIVGMPLTFDEIKNI